MAASKQLTTVRTLLIIWSIDKKIITYGLCHKGSYREYTALIPLLDQNIFTLLQKHSRLLNKLNGIAVVSSRLGSFATSRILLSTLNMLAWARDIPIINIESSWKEDGPLLQKSLEQSFNRVMFQQQLIPYYGSDADISQSKKKKKFTIT